MTSERNLDIAPHNPGGGELGGKIVIGTIIGFIVAIIIFLILVAFGGVFESAFKVQTSQVGIGGTGNPVLPLVLMIMTMFSTLVGSILFGIILNILFPGKYYDIGKILKLVSIENIFIFFIIALLYISYYTTPSVLFLFVAFHIFFATFISVISMEVFSNPNYSSVSILGGSIGFILSIVIFGIIYKFADQTNLDNSKYMLLLLPPVLAYSIIPMFHGIFEKLYYGFYEMGNNFLYLPTIDEVMVDEDEMDEINVEQ